jgi:hypothetical protein
MAIFNSFLYVYQAGYSLHWFPKICGFSIGDPSNPTLRSRPGPLLIRQVVWQVPGILALDDLEDGLEMGWEKREPWAIELLNWFVGLEW